MQRPIHTIQCGEVDELPRLVCVDVWLTELDSAENAQLRKLSSTPLNTLEVASHVERFWNQQAVIAHQRTKMIEYILRIDNPAGEVEVLGEGERRQTNLERATAHCLHPPRRS